MFIECSYAYRNPKNMKLVQLRNFFYLFEFKVLRHEERETQFLSMLTFPSNPTTCGIQPQTSGLASASSENRLASSIVEFPNLQPIASGHDVIHVPGPISYLGLSL